MAQLYYTQFLGIIVLRQCGPDSASAAWWMQREGVALLASAISRIDAALHDSVF
ncbi:MAG: hypothetical protein IKR25_11225 [Muribaculaceae bacterium]|nr:hypothetical protein [Muribaculaceae bacterium]